MCLYVCCYVFFFKQKTAYEMRISDWSSDVCSSDLDVEALSAAYTSSDAWARIVVQQVAQHAEPATMRCLGFCVSIDHARFMARRFTKHGIPSVAVWGDSPRDERHAALRDLEIGRASCRERGCQYV